METEADRALKIAERCQTWREAVERIVEIGMASCVGEADELIAEGEGRAARMRK